MVASCKGQEDTSKIDWWPQAKVNFGIFHCFSGSIDRLIYIRDFRIKSLEHRLNLQTNLVFFDQFIPKPHFYQRGDETIVVLP